MGGGITDVERGLTFPTGQSPEPIHAFDDEKIGVRILDQTALIRRIGYVLSLPNNAMISRVRTDLASNRANPSRQLTNGRWQSENERLLYMRSWLEITHFPQGNIDRDVIFGAMFAFEASFQHPDLIVSNLPNIEQSRGLQAIRSAKREIYQNEQILRDQQMEAEEEKEFLAEVERILALEDIESKSRLMRVNFRSYPRYTHGPIASIATVDSLIAAALLPAISLILDFIPIVGQIKGLAESIIGYDLIGNKLQTWERGLGLFLAILPGARGIFRAGKNGLKSLAAAGAQATKRGMKAIDVYRAAKVASRVREAELLAAKIGSKISPDTMKAVENVSELLGEMRGQSKRSWRAAAGTIDNGVGTSRTAAGIIDTAARVRGKVVAVTKATEEMVDGLKKAGVLLESISAIEKSGIKFSASLVKEIAKSKIAIDFANRFHKCPGFAEVLKDLAISSGKRDGALFVMGFATKKLNPLLAKFEMWAGISKRVRSTEVAARLVDITEGSVSYELKSWSKSTLEKAFKNPIQLVKDSAIFGTKNIKWVFNSAKGMSKEEIVVIFKRAVANDQFLQAKWPKGEALDRALDALVELFP